MRFMVDECTGPVVVEWLRGLGHEVYSVYEKARGIDDEMLLTIAHDEDYILITNDKDFGELIIRMNRSHKGLILPRLNDERPENKLRVLERLLRTHGPELENGFVVVTEKKVRVYHFG